MRYTYYFLVTALIFSFTSCKKKNLGNRNPNGTENAVKILPLGNSITIGYPHTYRYELYRLLTAEGYDFDFVGSENDNPARYEGEWDQDHEGHSGWTTLDIDELLGEWLQNYTPDIVLLHLGTNDVSAIDIGEMSLDDSEMHLRSIISKLRTSNGSVHVYLAQILPMLDDFGDPNPRVAEWNVRVDSLGSELSNADSPITVVDMNSGFGSADFDDGVHPNQSGAAKMAVRWKEALLP